MRPEEDKELLKKLENLDFDTLTEDEVKRVQAMVESTVDNFETTRQPKIMTKEQYMKEMREWPVPVCHLSFMDVIVGPPDPKDLLPVYDKIGLNIDAIEDVDVEQDNDLKDKVIKATKFTKRQMIEHQDLIMTYEACSMCKEPRILPPPMDEKGELIPKGDERRNPNAWYFDELYPPDQAKLLKMAKTRGLGSLRGKFQSSQSGDSKIGSPSGNIQPTPIEDLGRREGGNE